MFQSSFFFSRLHQKMTLSNRSNIIILAVFGTALYAQDELTKRMYDISNGPQQYYSSDAYSYFTSKGFSLPPQKSRDEAVRSFQAATRLAAMGSRAKEALSVLVTAYPQAVHVTEILNVHYSGEGTFEDWVQTYVAGEKNKFILSSPFLDYAAMSPCEPFIVSTPEVTRVNGAAVTIPTKDLVNISVTHTVYFGAYALTAITGEQFGVDREKWQQWWKNTPAAPAPATTAARPSGRLRNGQLFSDIVLRGKYRMFLSTGDNLVGRIEAKDDTSLILETSDGKAYTFRPSIIIRYEYLEPPKNTEPQSRNAAAIDSMPFSFDELRGRKIGGRQLEIHINSGMVFRGILMEIDSQGIKLQVGNSTIPITREVVKNIRIVPPPPKTAPPLQRQETAPAYRDTVVVKSTETDEWGKPKPDSTYVGTITGEEADFLIITTSGAADKRIPRNRIVRVVKKSTGSYEAVIKRYAKPLFCPNEMFLVDLPPGKPGRPFFKVCVDRYEYPNIKGSRPKINVSYDDARALCHKRGKRLCTAEEWQWACGGIEGYTYPYGWNPEEEKCNTDGSRPPEPSGSRHNCVSKFGGYDMAGNVFEWVIGPRKQPSFMGGPYSKCQTITEGVGGSAKPQSGFRCCKGN
ncbi:MAG: SUMF1/EgtB/PvdO family nonheme iron enzyme [Chitinispirillaceae bacterium]|nr:SUMF1/EgtB/PvdO family nonheme iron enzyme [Chitinispirillaceae bacterium]